MGGAAGLVVRVTLVAGRRGLLVRTEGRRFVGVTGGWVMILPPPVVGWNRRLGIVGRGFGGGAAGLAMGALRLVVGWNRRPMRIGGRFVGGTVGLVVRVTPPPAWRGLLVGTRIRRFVGVTVGLVMGALRLMMG